MTNFSYLRSKPLFKEFASACIDAENSMTVSYSTSAMQTRRALELAVKWVYSYDSDLKIPYQDNLSALIHEYTFKSTVDSKIFPMIQFIVSLGNKSAHTAQPVRRVEAVEALRGLYCFVSWIDYSYSEEIHEVEFNPELIPDGAAIENRTAKMQQELELLKATIEAKDLALEELLKSAQTREEFKHKREEPKAGEFKAEDISEFKTRKIYIDLMLEMAGWTIGSNCIEEVPVVGMPNISGDGSVDYVLYGSNGKPVAVVEAKRTSIDPKIGRVQAILYADCLEKQHGIRPFIFYSNGFETRFLDDRNSLVDRPVAGFFTPAEFDWFRQRDRDKQPLHGIKINESITDRVYQKTAITAVCERLAKGHRRALLVMATGTGKTRTAISIVDVLMRQGWVKNVLFLADRRELVKQAKKNFVAQLPNLSICNLLDGRDNPDSRMVFSTYPTMMNTIDQTKSKDGSRLFTPGHFDLIIVDEAHRSIYKKYQDIFTYFDGFLVGLTATPKSDVDIDTYKLFDMQTNVPTFAYELKEAVDQKHLVDYKSYESKMKFLEEGVHYDELSDKEKAHWEEVIDDEEKEDFDGDELNNFLFNAHTIDTVLQDLMTQGIRVQGRDQIGKTIIFAKNKKHADAVLDRFEIIFPSGTSAALIYNGIKYVDSVMDDFGCKDKKPQIAISVDMLDTGIDVPEIVNLVFFKKIRSLVKFWQMIGRGTRLCPDLFGIGDHKTEFRIFDYCGNFEFFRTDPKISESKQGKSLTELLFLARTMIAHKLQHLDHQTPEKQVFRTKLVDSLYKEVCGINESLFSSQLRIEYVHRYNKSESWLNITEDMISELDREITGLLTASQEEELAKRFDYLMYTIMLADLQGLPNPKQRKKLVGTGESLAKKGHMPRVQAQAEIINRIQQPIYWDEADIFEHESVRIALRDLLDLIEYEKKGIYYSNFLDEKISFEVRESSLTGYGDYRSYRAKVESYLKEHTNDLVIHKLRNNLQLNSDDLTYIEKILWKDLGTEDDYHKEFGEEPLLTLVARLVGMERTAAMDLFSQFLSDNSLNTKQINFVQHVVEYVIQNGAIHRSQLQNSPFNDYGSITDLFDGKRDSIMGIIKQIDQLNGRLQVG